MDSIEASNTTDSSTDATFQYFRDEVYRLKRIEKVTEWRKQYFELEDHVILNTSGRFDSI